MNLDDIKSGVKQGVEKLKDMTDQGAEKLKDFKEQQEQSENVAKAKDAIVKNKKPLLIGCVIIAVVLIFIFVFSGGDSGKNGGDSSKNDGGSGKKSLPLQVSSYSQKYYNEIHRQWSVRYGIELVATDDIIINSITVNRGNCKAGNNAIDNLSNNIAAALFGGKPEPEFPFELKYGSKRSIKTDCSAILDVTIETNKGTSNYTFRQ